MARTAGQSASFAFRNALSRAIRLGARRGLDLVFPPRCLLCRQPLEDACDAALCPVCVATAVAASPACPRCGLTVPELAQADSCARCRGRRFQFSAVARLGTYEGALRTAVLRTKNSRERALAAALGSLLADTAGDRLAALQADVVVPVPMHWARRVWRGGNSPDVVARQLATRLKLPVRGELLVRRRRTAPQASVSPARRRANVRGAFRACRHRDLDGAKVLLVDDIMTSGATVNEAAKTLRSAGAAWVAVTVLARAPGFD